MADDLHHPAAQTGAPYGMTGDQVLSLIANGETWHPNAQPNECGIVDPRDDRRWCRRPFGHADHHNCYHLEDDWPGAAPS
ncbi:hypothetical protein ACIBG7_15135 [Nonomuraea sp. NPDC050328]|uniref:hypothetical protein n=1 Tax=Nonomuraea sp. NPDC050328 TaxID=3364361 RepID=UPI0037AE283E